MTAAVLESAADVTEVWLDPNEAQEKTEQRTVPMEGFPQDFEFEQVFDIEVDYGHTRFPIEGDLSVHVVDPQHAPIRLGYSDENGTLEVIGWGLTVPIEESGDLPRRIGRRFLELYSKAVTGTLHPEERDWLRTISDQMDYHAFAAGRKLPRYREATLVRKSPVLLVQFIEDRNVKLDSALAAKLWSLDEGDRFGAWFTLDGNGNITDLNHIILLPPLDNVLGDATACSGRPVEFPDSLKALLPRA
jgi:hypothetical protein